MVSIFIISLPVSSSKKSDTNSEPFTVGYYTDAGIVGFISIDSKSSHDIRIYQQNSSIEIKPFTVTKNGKYTAPDGVAYSPVTVSVPSDGVIDFPYDLEETFPETELFFGFDEENRTVTFRITDKGIPFDPLKKPDPDITLSAEEREIGGLGIFIAKKTMDSICYAYENGENILTMTKKI